MARIAGVNIPENKHLEIANPYIWDRKKNGSRYLYQSQVGLF